MARLARSKAPNRPLAHAVLPIVPVYEQPTRLVVKILGGTYAGNSYYLTVPIDSPVTIGTTETTWEQLPEPSLSLTSLPSISDQTLIGNISGATATPTELTRIQAADLIHYKGTDVASAANVNLDATTGDFVDITGTTNITTLNVSDTTGRNGDFRIVRFMGVLTLSHSTFYCVLPGSANITTAAGDIAMFRYVTGTGWVCICYQRASGLPLITSNADQFEVGDVKPIAYSSVSTNWLDCDGSAISRTTYATLFAKIGTTWGAGNGTTTFNIPDFRGRGLIGAGTGSGLSARTLGTQNIGVETHGLSSGENGSHSHNGSSGHSFLTSDTSAAFAVTIAAGGRNYYNDTSTATSGSGTAHQNMQPSAVVKWVIKWQ